MQRRSYILLGLVFAALLGVLACLRMQERALIDFEQNYQDRKSVV